LSPRAVQLSTAAFKTVSGGAQSIIFPMMSIYYIVR
jgi:hypothetical protein